MEEEDASPDTQTGKAMVKRDLMLQRELGVEKVCLVW
jgi:hypothetical protein